MNASFETGIFSLHLQTLIVMFFKELQTHIWSVILSKILEKVVFKQINSFLSESKILETFNQDSGLTTAQKQPF